MRLLAEITNFSALLSHRRLSYYFLRDFYVCVLSTSLRCRPTVTLPLPLRLRNPANKKLRTSPLLRSLPLSATMTPILSRALARPRAKLPLAPRPPRKRFSQRRRVLLFCSAPRSKSPQRKRTIDPATSQPTVGRWFQCQGEARQHLGRIALLLLLLPV